MLPGLEGGDTLDVLESGKLVMMSRRALDTSAYRAWLDDVLWEHEKGAVVLLIPEHVSVWRGFVMAEHTERTTAVGAVELFAALYFDCEMSLPDAWAAAEAVTSDKTPD